MNETVRIRGEASAEEVIAVLAALNRGRVQDEPSRYELWRSGRIRASRASHLAIDQHRDWKAAPRRGYWSGRAQLSRRGQRASCS